MEPGNCRLCEQPRALEDSHIIPKFVIRWQNETAISPLRNAEKPNLRIQDGTKLPFLCADCEDLIGKFETPFAANIFAPVHRPIAEVPNEVAYQSWCLKFAVSVSWRVLKFWSEDPRFPTLAENRRERVARALARWRSFLLEREPHPGQYEQHILPLSLVDQPIPGLSPFFNRYALRAVEHYFSHTSDVMFVYAKLGRLALFGMLPSDHRVPGWPHTKLHVRKGTIRLRDAVVEVPEVIIRFMSERADYVVRSFGEVSSRQKEKIQATTQRALRDMPEREMFQALVRDWELFGDAALENDDSGEERNA